MKIEPKIAVMDLQTEMPNIADSCPKPGERHGIDSPIEPPKETNPANTMILQL